MIEPNIDETNLEISFSCASPYPCRRWDDAQKVEYIERLVITPEAVDMTRLNGGASVLKNHDTDKVVGKVVRAWIEEDALCVRIRFRTDDMSRSLFDDIAAGIVPNVSIGYGVEDYTPHTDESGTLVRDVTRWTAYEVSIAVGVPADPTVGFYRSLSVNNIAARNDNNHLKEGQMNKRADENPNDSEVTMTPEEMKARLDALEAENAELKKKACGEGEGGQPPAEQKDCGGDSELSRSLRQFGLDIVKAIQAPHVRTSAPRQYNITNLLAHMAGARGVDAKYELERSDELYRSLGMKATEYSVMIPFDGFRSALAPYAKREMNDTVGSGSGLVAQQNLPDMFVAFVRNKIGVKNATFIPGLTGGPVTIPAQTSDVTVAWVSGGTTTTNANAELSETSTTIGDITLNPNKLGAYVDVGKDLLLMSNPYATGIVTDSLLAGIAHKLGTTMLKGNASNPSINGLATATGVQTAVIADISQTTWPMITAMVGTVDGLEFNGTQEWVMGASDKGTLKAIAKGQYGSGFICQDDYIDGRLVHVDGSLSSGDIFFGDFSNILVGQWGGIEVFLDPFSGSKSGKVCVIVSLVCDIGIARPNTFVKRVAA